MQAIISKFIPATNVRGSRIKATAERGSITLSWPDELSGDACHVWAADQLVAKFVAEDVKTYGTPKDKNPWSKPRVVGTIPSGEVVHVYANGSNSVLLQLADADDAQNVRNYAKRAKETEGTVGGLYSGLLCSALKRANL